jgi:DNA-binding CsgD family transcriptional regulator
MGDRPALVGRDREIAALTAFLDEGRPGGLVLTGEAGLGKSALWELAGSLAVERGAFVLSATPGEGEQRYSFSVLLELFRDVDLATISLADPVREALETVLLRGAGAGPVDPHVVSVGTLELLAGLAVERQVLVLVDDVQWADAISMEALAYAARRPAQAPVQFVLTRRAGFARSRVEAAMVRRDLRYLEPRALRLEESTRLLSQELALSLSPRVLRLVHEQCHGNPLFTLEVGRALLERGVPEIGGALGVPSEMAAMLGLRVRDLDPLQRTLLLAVALDPQLSERALVGLVGPEAVQRAVDDGLVRGVDGGRARAWHPLLAAAAREEAAPSTRRELHARLADVVDRPEATLRHSALALDSPDEELAARLSVAAREAADRGALETALELAELALARTAEDSPTRSRRVLGLAERMGHASEAQQLTEFLEPEIQRMPMGPERGQAWLMMLDGMVGTVANMERMVDLALAECGGDPQVRGQALDAKSFIAGGMKVSGVAQALRWAEEAIDLGVASQSRDWSLVHGGRPPERRSGPAWWKRLIWRGELDAAEKAVRAAIAEARDAGRLQEAILLQTSLSDVLVRSGRIDEARAVAAAQDDQDLAAKETPDEELLHAEIEARNGDVTAARDWAHLALDRARQFEHVWIELEAERALALADLQSGEPGEAERRLRGVFDRTVRAGVREPGMFPVTPELVEVLVLQGRRDEPREVLRWLEEVTTEQDHPWGRAMVSRSRLLIGLLEQSLTPLEADARTAEVTEEMTALRLRHDAARTHLVVGSALRRQRQWGLARDHLLLASDGFDAMGATGWAHSARSELGRVGGRRPAEEGELTPAEHEVARLAADGLANKQIARQVNVSVSTVEAQLTRAYAKLGVRSRAQLSARLDELRGG